MLQLHLTSTFLIAPKTKSVSSRIVLVEEWYRDGGVFILGYGMFRELCVPRGGQGSEVGARYRELFQDGPSLIIADEGHNLKNAQAKLATAANNLKSTARVILTGHPLQNRLEEYWCMVDFVRPNFLGDIATFRHNYIRPINEGLYPDSSIFEKKASAKKLKVLTELIKNFVMRKDSSVLKATLPKKVEFVVSCKLSTMQYYLYTSFLPTLDPTTRAVLGNGYCLLTICNHPAVFKATLFEMMRRKKADKTVAASSNDTKAISAVDSPTTAVPESLADAVGEDSGDETTKEAEQALRYGFILPRTASLANVLYSEFDQGINTVCLYSQNASVLSNHWSGSFIQEKNVNDISHSYKIKILMDILQACRDVNEKVLVFSRSIPTLDYIERITKEAGFWSMRLDGDTPIVDRQNMINTFNTSAKYHLFLISSNAGSLGVNLVSASRVVIFDVGWNPSHDEQAIARAFRYGQKRKVFVYRLQTFGTWEDKLYKTNLHKLGLSTRVVDKKNMIKSYTKTEMTKYFEQPPETTPVWASQENVDTLFTRPDTDDPVLRSVIDR
ncbi:P-loop containing nucleoside triphosphate hydrolase protein [Gamsiella multidivaricata]|uniref:P-loop containing nucleoside triphosphate hydrolase protein n=1 Tax=Gamsiella multidivaricata TaxID=101098 RepID=UPI0022204D37|nr:P-loop containing nucleoside triphosphate hydrolase protein [Gamsiella multidivaricata]KAI7818928.1 P-loop containing nucleoside triphosphate hydrolase protein [Gamsiella multidivaricata]